MADEPKIPETDDELQLTEEDQLPPGDDQADTPDDEGDGEDEEVVTFGDEAEPQEGDTGLVKHLREQVKIARREAAEARKSAPAQKIEVGEKPTLWDDGIDGDEDKYDAAMDAWKGRKATADRQASEQTQSTEEQQRSFIQRIEKVVAVKASLGADADTAFENVKAALGEDRAAAIVQITDTPEAAARLIYALGKYPDRLAELAAEQDPIRFLKQVTKLEGQVKTVKRKRVIEPDMPERGSGRVSRETSDRTLAKLEAEADKTGERSKLIAYKKKLKAAAKT